MSPLNELTVSWEIQYYVALFPYLQRTHSFTYEPYGVINSNGMYQLVLW